jgi:hypothetical protein
LFFYNFHLFSLTILSRSYYSTVVDTPYDGVLHALSLDFDHYQLERILSKADPRVAEAEKLGQARRDCTGIIPRDNRACGGGTTN